MGQEWPLSCLPEYTSVNMEEMRRQRGSKTRRRDGFGGNNGLAVTGALACVWTPPLDLEVWIGLLATEYLAGRSSGQSGLNRSAIVLLLLGGEMGLGIRRGEVSLALLQMLDLARRVLCADVAAVATADLVALGGSLLVLELSKGAPDVRIGMSAHGGGSLPLWRLA